MPSPAGAADLFADLSRALASLDVRWFVFGAQAVLVWGRPRFTTDVDVTVELGSIDIASVAVPFISAPTVLSRPRGDVATD